MDVVTRQAHPGPGVPPYRSESEKMRDAERYQREDGITWPVLVDDLEGTVHQVYGGMADPTYLVDAEGRIAFYNMWTHAPTLHGAIGALLARGGAGVVRGGIDHLPHMLAAMTDGWRGLARGLPQSVTDLMTAAPGMAAGIWLGDRMKPVLAPATLRATPWPPAAKAGVALGALALLALAARGVRSRTSRPRASSARS